MKNVQMKTEGKKLVITVDLDTELGPSKSGKTVVIATTNGNQPLPNTQVATFIGLNIFKRRF